MRPSFPTPQGRSVRHPSKLHPRTERIRGTIHVRFSFQIDGFLTGPSQLFKGDSQPMNQKEKSVLWLPKTSLPYGDFQTGETDLWRFADRCSIP